MSSQPLPSTRLQSDASERSRLEEPVSTAAATRWDVWARQRWRTSLHTAPSPAVARELAALADQRDLLLRVAAIVPGDVVVIAGASAGLLTSGAAAAAGATGRIITLDPVARTLALAADSAVAVGLPVGQAVHFARTRSGRLPLAASQGDVVLARAQVTGPAPDEARQRLQEYRRILRPGGRLALLEPLWCEVWWRAPVGAPPMAPALQTSWYQATRPASSPSRWRPDERELLAAVTATGFRIGRVVTGAQQIGELSSPRQVLAWWQRAACLRHPAPCTILTDRLSMAEGRRLLAYWVKAAEHGPVQIILPLRCIAAVAVNSANASTVPR